jgi:hypothetical protein
MATIRRRGGLFVATAAVCAIILSAPTIEQVEADAVVAVANALRGGRRDVISNGERSYYSASIHSRRLEEGEGEEDRNESGDEEEEGEDEKEEEQQQQYQEGNNDDGDDQEEQNGEAEQEEQQEEENEEEMEEDAANDDANANDDQAGFSSNVQDTVADVQDNFQDLMDRFDEDVMNMWSTSPSQWDEECWKVFAGVGGAFALLLSCLLYLCCMCCNGDQSDEDRMFAAKADADKRAKKNHRGRLFARMRNNDDTDTVTSHHTGLTDNDYERPFVLIEDVEKDNTMNDDKSKSTAGMDGLTSPVYARGSASGTQHENVISPTEHKMNDFSNRALASPGSKHPVPVTAGTMSIDDAETLHSKDTFKSVKSQSSRKPHGIINETVDVWSEFLGFKKHKYKFKPGAISKDEDEDINLTDDEGFQRKNRRSSPKKMRGRSSIPVAPQMKAGIYTRPPQQESDVEIGPGVSDSALSSTSHAGGISNEERLSVETPMMSNAMTNARATKPNSPRRTALIKTKNLLKSFGSNGNKNKINRNGSNTDVSDSKEEALLSTEEQTDTVYL